MQRGATSGGGFRVSCSSTHGVHTSTVSLGECMRSSASFGHATGKLTGRSYVGPIRDITASLVRPSHALSLGGSVGAPGTAGGTPPAYHSAASTSRARTVLFTIPVSSQPSCTTAPLNSWCTCTRSMVIFTPRAVRGGIGCFVYASTAPPYSRTESSLVLTNESRTVLFAVTQTPSSL